MMGFVPPRPTGSSREALFDQAIWDSVFGPAAAINSSGTVSVSKTSRGCFLNATAGGGGGALSVDMYFITELVEQNYFFGKPYSSWNPDTGELAADQVPIAKCIAGRMNVSEWIDGHFFTYIYAQGKGDNLRTQLYNDAVTEWHTCHPRYRVFKPDPNNPGASLPGDALVAVLRVRGETGVLDANGQTIDLLEVSPQRFWAYQYNQSGPAGVG